jgi:hypothetical protein
MSPLSRRSVGWAALALAGLVAQGAAAQGLQRVTGRVNDPATECLSRFEGTPPNAPPARPRKVLCVDNDPACDADPAAGLCGISIEVRFNANDPGNPQCAPDALEEYLVQNWVPDTHPKHDFSFQNLEDVVTFLALPLDPTDTDVLSLPVVIDVPLRLRPRPGGGRWVRARKVLKTRVSTGTGARFDVDRMPLVCLPGSSSPCDGVTGTFDQLQKQVLNRSCAVPTCHVAPTQPHLLSLLPGAAYDSLVNAIPANGEAQAAGKLRVHAGVPENSFLLDKLRGRLGPDEGERMPLGRPSINRRVLIRLVEDWIQAGAPATGFVSDRGCSAP